MYYNIIQTWGFRHLIHLFSICDICVLVFQWPFHSVPEKRAIVTLPLVRTIITFIVNKKSLRFGLFLQGWVSVHPK